MKTKTTAKSSEKNIKKSAAIDPETEDSLWDRTLRQLRRLLPSSGSKRLRDIISPNLNKQDCLEMRRQIDNCLTGKGGEVSARIRAVELGKTYLTLSRTGKKRFFQLLVDYYDVDENAIDDAIALRHQTTDVLQRQRVNFNLRELLYPARMRLLSQFNMLDEGVKFLVDLRAELLSFLKESPSLKVLDDELHRLFASWFDVGFLDLYRITWNSPAALLEKLTAYEAVHAVLSWQDLKNRLSRDRRCYAFFHPRMPEEPLIFVEIALAQGVVDNVHDLLDEDAPVGNPENADTAIFYSISNCQVGLSRVSFGNFLIKRVVTRLSQALPNIKTFATLSPIPGFRKWLDNQLLLEQPASPLVPKLQTLLGQSKDAPEINSALMRLLKQNEPNSSPEFKELMLKLCAYYLVQAKYGQYALDKVANFHLSNGARMQRLNWQANHSIGGLKQSAGIMINYIYDLDYIEKNHERYTGKGEIALSSSIKKLVVV